MSDQRPTGHVEPSPEAESLDSTSGTVEPVANTGSASSAPQTWGQSATSEPAAAGRSDDLMQRLKPIAEAAENIAGTAATLSARGLTKLADILKERRQRRGQDGQ